MAVEFAPANGRYNERIIEARPPEIKNPLDIAWAETSFMPEGIRDENPVPQLEISLMGQGAFGFETYEGLKSQGHKVGVVFAPVGKNALREAVLKDQNDGINVRLYDLPDKREGLTTPEAIDAFNQNDPDIGVFASMTTIAPKEIFDGPKMGTLIYHNSLVPEGRGGSAMENALMKGKKMGGISIILADEGADTGDVILQSPMELRDYDTPFSVNADTYKLGVQMMIDSVEIAARGKLDQVRIPQDKSVDTEEPFIGKLGIDWNRSSEEVYNLLRGTLNKKPFALLENGKPHVLNATGDISWMVDRKYAFLEPGTIVEINDKGMVVVTGDGGAVRIGTLQLSQIYKGGKTGTIYETKKSENIGSKKKALQLAIDGVISVGQKFAQLEEAA